MEIPFTINSRGHRPHLTPNAARASGLILWQAAFHPYDCHIIRVWTTIGSFENLTAICQVLLWRCGTFVCWWHTVNLVNIFKLICFKCLVGEAKARQPSGQLVSLQQYCPPWQVSWWKLVNLGNWFVSSVYWARQPSCLLPLSLRQYCPPGGLTTLLVLPPGIRGQPARSFATTGTRWE